MTKKFLKILFSIPVVALVYVPIILLLIEFHHIPKSHNNWLQDSLAFLLFWGGWFIWLWCFKLLKTKGEGEPLPMAGIPTNKLVREGPYKYVRNPMSVAVWAILLGEAVYFNSIFLCLWTVLVIVAVIYYVVKIEEPQMFDSFGQRYMEYRADVKRFWLRFR